MCDEIMQNSRSTTGSNIRNLLLRYNGGTFDELRENVRKSPPYMTATEADLWKIEAVKDLTEAIYDRSVLPGFEREEIQQIRNHISTV